jgi:hypothetical protein
VTCTWRPPYYRGKNTLPWRKMIAADLGLDLLRQHDAILAAVGIEAPYISSWKRHAQNHAYFAGLRAAATPRSEAQHAYNRSRGTVESKIVRQEVQSILARYRRLGEVRNQ